MNLIVVLIIVLLLLGTGAGPWWPHSAAWGYYPVGGVGLIVIIPVLILLLR